MQTPDDSGLRSVLTVCPFCACGCGLHLEGTRAGIRGVGPSEHHPVSRGRLCARGWAAHEATVWGPRLDTPLVRRDGVLQPASWSDALDTAVASLRRVRDGGRPTGVLGSGRATNEENFLALTLARSALGSGNVDSALGNLWTPLLEAGAADRDAGLDLMDAFAAVDDADLILVVEGDLVSTHPRMAQSVLRAVRRGGRLVTLGWTPTELSALASRHIALRPGAPLAALASIRDAVAQRPAGAMDQVASERPSRQAGQPADASGAEEVVEWVVAASRPAFIIGAFDLDRALLRGAATMLRSLTEDLVRLGGRTPRFIPLPVRANTRGAVEMGMAPDALPGWRPLEDAGLRDALLRLWGGVPYWGAGVGAELLPAAVAGLVAVADDFAGWHPAPARVRPALRALETLVVLDCFFTPTAQLAHVVLPIASFGEAEGTVTSLEGRIQRVRPRVAPADGVRPGWLVLRDLAAGLGAAFQPDRLARVQAAIGGAVPGYEAMNERPHADDWLVSAQPFRKPRHVLTDLGDAAVDRSFSASAGCLLRPEGVFDWGRDPLVEFSPTLRRDAASRRKLYPRGLAVMRPEDAEALGLKAGRMARLRSVHGVAEVPIALRAGLDPGCALLPFAFREELAAVLGDEVATAVELGRA